MLPSPRSCLPQARGPALFPGARAPLRRWADRNTPVPGAGRSAFESTVQWKALMRLFIGLDVPPDVVGKLEALLDRLRPAARINWCAPSNLHITTKFIGEWPEERLDELKTALS